MSHDDNDSSSSGPSWSAVGDATCLDWRNDPNAIWPYCPSLPAAIIFTILFSTATILHLWQAIRYRKPFCWVIIMAGVWQSVGFAIRAAATQHQQALFLYVPSQILILLAPLWINAFIYLVFGRMVWFFLPEQKVIGIKARWLTVIFVLSDVFTFLVQANGAGMLSNTDPNSVRAGQIIYMAGMGTQEGFLICFSILVATFHRRMLQRQNTRSTDWRWLIYLIEADIILITLRIVYHLVQFATGVDSPVAHEESLFYVLDALPMFVAIALFDIYHPGRALVGPESEFPKRTRAEKKEERRQEKEARQQRKMEKRGKLPPAEV